MSFKRKRTYRKKPAAKRIYKKRRTTTRRRAPARRGSFIDDVMFNKKLGRLPRALINYTFDQFVPTGAKNLIERTRHHLRTDTIQENRARAKDMQAYGADGPRGNFYKEFIKDNVPIRPDGKYFPGTDAHGSYYLDGRGNRHQDIEFNYGKIGQYLWNGLKAASELGFTGPLEPAIKIGTKAEKILKELNRELRR